MHFELDWLPGGGIGLAFLPFDPSRAKGSPRADSASPSEAKSTAADVLTVSDVADMVNQALVAGLPSRVRVVGEVSNLSARQHWFFSLKDENAVLKCVAWKSRAARFGFVPDNGMEVVASGSIQHYGPQGQTQMYVESLEPVGAGALEMKYRALCEELRGLGYFDPDRKRGLPAFPRSVAVITSAKGAALQDVIDTMRRRCPAIRIVTVDVLVQGQAAASSIVAGLARVAAAQERMGIDVVMLTRGGGSLEDLWAFNERAVADALLDYPIPVVAAIGHETDTTIAELVADLRCATPTQAAMTVTPDRSELSGRVRHMQQRLSLLITQACQLRRQRYATVSARYEATGSLFVQTRSRLDRVESRLRQAVTSLVHRRSSEVHRVLEALRRVGPQQALSDRERRLAVLACRLDWSGQSACSAWDRSLNEVRQRLDTRSALCSRNTRAAVDALAAQLQAVNPRSVLQRGYSITRVGGTVVRDAADARPGEELETQVFRGRIRSRVMDSNDAGDEPAAPPPRRTKRTARHGESGPSLFDG
ncbi:MAG: exodeoxyribonuclease VII large subunit [Planctomycetes bacterium]|nr:exodeoxyribonuclease VII large subunit [Planctomycetota bacterium]NOG54123.1 exodeoxyribonuclease VII large subunit [Planctomycetota bacterium]